MAAAIPDQLIVELYTSEAGLRRWCNQQLWPSEVAALLELLQQKSDQRDRFPAKQTGGGDAAGPAAAA